MNEKGYSIFELLAVVIAVASISFLGFLFYSAIHFIGKYW